MSKRSGGIQTLTFQAAPPEADHFCGCGGLVDKDQPMWHPTHTRLTMCPPDMTHPTGPGAPSLHRQQRFFYMWTRQPTGRGWQKKGAHAHRVFLPASLPWPGGPAALWRRGWTSLHSLLHQLDDKTGANPEPAGNLAPWEARIDLRENTLAQVWRIRFAHDPPPTMVNHKLNPLGIPYDSK